MAAGDACCLTLLQKQWKAKVTEKRLRYVLHLAQQAAALMMKPQELSQIQFILLCALDGNLCGRDYEMYTALARWTIRLSSMATIEPTQCAILASFSLFCMPILIPQPWAFQQGHHHLLLAHQVSKNAGPVKRAEDPERSDEAWKLSLHGTLGFSGARMSKRQLMVDALVCKAALAPVSAPEELRRLLEFALIETISKRTYETTMFSARQMVRALYV